MAQRIITLANEETSQDILSRVEAIEAKVNQMQPIVTQVGGVSIHKSCKYTVGDDRS